MGSQQRNVFGTMRGKLNKILEAEYNHREYLKWKRKNVSFRGMGEVGVENGGIATGC